MMLNDPLVWLAIFVAYKPWCAGIKRWIWFYNHSNQTCYIVKAARLYLASKLLFESKVELIAFSGSQVTVSYSLDIRSTKFWFLTTLLVIEKKYQKLLYTNWKFVYEHLVKSLFSCIFVSWIRKSWLKCFNKKDINVFIISGKNCSGSSKQIYMIKFIFGERFKGYRWKYTRFLTNQIYWMIFLATT